MSGNCSQLPSFKQLPILIGVRQLPACPAACLHCCLIQLAFKPKAPACPSQKPGVSSFLQLVLCPAPARLN